MNSATQFEENFILTESGLINRGLKKLNLEHKRWRLAFLVLCVTWLPLVILTAIDGKLYAGTGLPFLKDIAMQGRILLGIPMLILIKPLVYNPIPRVLKYISDVLIIPEARVQFFSGALRKAKKSTDSIGSEIIILFMVIAFTLSPAAELTSFIAENQSSSWLIDQINGKDDFSQAGKFAQYIAKPLFQFLLIRWLWRYIVWIILLFRISKFKLKLNPTHPDGTGGISIIFLAQRNFIFFFVVCGMVISTVMINLINSKTLSFDAIKVEIFGYIIFSIFLILFPLVFFGLKLVKTKYEGQLELSEAASNLSHRYENEFVKPMKNEKRIAEETVDPSMQVDYAGVYIMLQDLRIIPVRFRDFVIIILSLFIPFLPIFFIQYSVVELLQKLMGLLV